MVNCCVVVGCQNLKDPRNQISFHMFPFSRPEILKLWVQAIRREKWYPSKSSRLCSQHFLVSDYQVKPGCALKLLKLDAVPSVFNFPKHLMKRIVPRRKLVRQVETPTEVNMDIDLNLPSTSSTSTPTPTSTCLVNAETQTSSEVPVFHLRRKVKTLQQKVRRRDIKITSMKDVIKHISESGLSNDSLNDVLKNYFEGLPFELLMLQQKDKTIHPGQRRYTDVMRQFAHTLYFYSPKAYNFLRQYFVLPNGRTIRKWLCSVNCQPGILSEVLAFLKEEVKNQPHLAQCALIMDGMSIRSQVVWDASEGRFTGNIDYGGIIDVDYEMAATEALFFQIVSYSKNFKCPIAYFLINKVDANLQAQLINACIRSLYEIGIKIKSITSDGTRTNIATYNNLGCNVSSENLLSYFQHPCIRSENIYCMLDTCHMMKLARNTFGETNLKSNSGDIKWEFLKQLDELQQTEQLKLANSLSSHHIFYKNKIMNVRLAAQALSSGVADAIEYLKNCGHEHFQNSEATIEFIRVIDKIFDMLNSRSPYGKGFKAPIRPNTIKYFEEVFGDAINYLRTLSINSVLVTNHNRKTFALGFILTMTSTIALAKDLLNINEGPLQYVLTYKCSQDHIELYFSCLRSRGGWNNNPNSQQLKWSLRQLLLKNSISSSGTGNCSNFNNYSTPAFEFRSDGRKRQETASDEDFNEIEKYIILINEKTMTDFQENVIYYICGYIVRNLIKKLTCTACVNILINKNKSAHDHLYSADCDNFKKFTNLVTRGGLIYASDIVYKIVSFAERQFRCIVEQESLLGNKKNIKILLTNTAINYFSSKLNLFKPYHPPTQEFIAEDLHEIQLIRKIIDIFLQCRMNHHSKLINFKIHGKTASVRQKMNKIVLFKNC